MVATGFKWMECQRQQSFNHSWNYFAGDGVAGKDDDH